jgi:hypothetical protein
MAMLALTCCCVPLARSELIEAGANVPLLPNGLPAPEPCTETSRAFMNAIQLKAGDTAKVELDANQYEREPLTVQAGPIESIMLEPMGDLGGATRLYGRVWTSGPRVVIRYYRAQRATGGNPIPICAVARAGGGQLEGRHGKYPGSAELPYSSALAFVVQDFL